MLVNPSSWVKCCDMDSSSKAWRTSFMVMCNTPYCIGFIVAVLLNAILPIDDEIEDATKVGDKGAESAQA